MSEVIGHPVAFTELEDGTFLAASVQRPWFAVSGESLDDARARASRALAFHARQRPTIKPFRPEHQLVRFAPLQIENLKPAEELCA